MCTHQSIKIVSILSTCLATAQTVHTSNGQIHEKSTKIPTIDAMHTNKDLSSQKSTTAASLIDFIVELTTNAHQEPIITTTTEVSTTKRIIAKPTKISIKDAMATDKDNQTSFTTQGPPDDTVIVLSTSKPHILTTTESFTIEPMSEQSTTIPLLPTMHTPEKNHSSFEAKSSTLNPLDGISSDPSANKPNVTTESPLPLPMHTDDEFMPFEKIKKRRNSTLNTNFIPTIEKFKCMTYVIW